CACYVFVFFFFSSRRRHTRFSRDWSSDVYSSDLAVHDGRGGGLELGGGGGRGDRGRGWGAGEHVAGGPCGADRPGAGDPGEQAERGQPVWAAGYGLPAEQRAQPRAGGGVHGAGGGFGDAAGPEGAE